MLNGSTTPTKPPAKARLVTTAATPLAPHSERQEGSAAPKGEGEDQGPKWINPANLLIFGLTSALSGVATGWFL